jgi:hypothetical protein
MTKSTTMTESVIYISGIYFYLKTVAALCLEGRGLSYGGWTVCKAMAYLKAHLCRCWSRVVHLHHTRKAIQQIKELVPHFMGLGDLKCFFSFRLRLTCCALLPSLFHLAWLRLIA